jgi:hypothetical protein
MEHESATLIGRPLRVCYFGTYRAEYSRNRIMIEGLRQAGVEVVECQEQLWKSIEDRVETASGGWLRPGFMLRVLRAYVRLIQRHRQSGDYDVMVAGYPGQMDIFLARYLSRRRGKPLVWDIFMSIYLIALERGLDQRSRLSVNLIQQIEKRALALPDPGYRRLRRLVREHLRHPPRPIPSCADGRG